jgi:methyl-accepting chemotaxis protein
MRKKDLHEKKLSEYSRLLDRFKECISEYTGIYDEISKKAADSQLTSVQLAVDITRIKDMIKKLASLLEEASDKADYESIDKLTAQNDKIMEQIESLTASIIEVHYKLEGVDKNAVNRLSDILIELQKQTLNQYKQNMAEIQESYEKLRKSVVKNRVWGVLSFVLQLIGLGGIAFIILYLLEIIII